MSNDLVLSEKHGVNASVMKCFYCGKDMGVALLGRLKDDVEAPRECVLNYEPCDDCKKYMEEGIIVIGVKDGSNEDNPYRTGEFLVITEDGIGNIINPDSDLYRCIMEHRFVFIEHSVLKNIVSVEDKLDNLGEEVK